MVLRVVDTVHYLCYSIVYGVHKPIEIPNENGTGPKDPAMNSNKLNLARIADLHRAMMGHVERGAVPGIVTLISRGDETASSVAGNLIGGEGKT